MQWIAPVDSVGRLRAPGRGGRGGPRGRRRQRALRCYGQSLRAEPDRRSGRVRGAAPARHRGADRRASDGRPVDRIVPDFAAAGATYISFHPEASEHVDRTIDHSRARLQAGAGVQPATSLDWLDYTLEQLDLVLLMSVNPGFGGQKFIPRRAAQDCRGAPAREPPAGARCAWRSMAGSKWTISPPRRRPAPICLWPARRSFGSKDYGATIRAMRAALAGRGVRH
jgi:hypothetical protein